MMETVQRGCEDLVTYLQNMAANYEQAVPPEEAANGPVSPDEFHFGNRKVQGLTRAQYSLLSLLWDEAGHCPARPVSLAELARRLCPRAKADKIRALMSLRARTQAKLDRVGAPLSIDRSNDTLRLVVNPS
jgi:hypothetical protein